MRSSLIPLVMATAAALAGCSSQNSRPAPSSLSDVANPGTPGGRNFLFWADQNDIHRGDCAEGRVPSRANCASNVQRSPAAATAQRAGEAAAAALTAADAEVAREVTALKDADPTVIALRAEIQTLTQQETQLERAIANSEAAIADLNTVKAGHEERIAYDDEQLAAVAAALEAKPDDANLLALQAALRAEREEYAAALADVTTQIEALSERLAYDEATLADVTPRLAERQARLTQVYDELVVRSERLDTLRAKRALAAAAVAGVPSVVEMIQTSAVTYRGNLLSEGLQESLRLVSEAIRPALVLTPGRYEKISGSGNYCPQRAEPTMNGSTLISVRLTYLSPCGGVTDVYTCNGNRCVARGSWVMTIIDATNYDYAGGSGTSRFKFIRPSLDDEGTEDGPLNILPEM